MNLIFPPETQNNNERRNVQQVRGSGIVAVRKNEQETKYLVCRRFCSPANWLLSGKVT